MYVNIKMQLKMPLMDTDKLKRIFNILADELSQNGCEVIMDHGGDPRKIEYEIAVESGKTSWNFNPRKQPKKKSRNNVALEQQAA